MTRSYRIEHWRTELGMWEPLTESPERTYFRLYAVTYPTREVAEDAIREMIAVGWLPERLRVAEYDHV